MKRDDMYIGLPVKATRGLYVGIVGNITYVYRITNHITLTSFSGKVVVKLHINDVTIATKEEHPELYI